MKVLSNTGLTYLWLKFKEKFAPVSHTHAINNIDGLQTTLNSKANSSHSHSGLMTEEEKAKLSNLSVVDYTLIGTELHIFKNPSSTNYAEATISGGKLGDGGNTSKPSDTATAYHKIFNVSGNTAQFYFKSDASVRKYGYYAIIRGF